MRLLPDKTNIKFVNKKFWCLPASIIVLVATLVLLFTKGLNFGIDFTGGVLIEFKAEQTVDIAKLRQTMPEGSTLQALDHPDEVMIRIPVTEGQSNEAVVGNVKDILSKNITGQIDYRKTDYVGPQVGSELIMTAIYALLGSIGAMLIYIWFRFEWQYGLGAILALLHDAVATIGFFIITGLDFDLSAVAAVLTIIGYSINDSVVIYDRVRENIRKYKKMSLGELIDLSVNETLSRTMFTGGTTLLSIVALIVLGGPVLQSFSWGMFFGIIIGTYSSIYISAVVLLYLDPRKNNDEAK